ncbi:hypothetical protein ACV35N_34750, partial [Pseudomonas aeruginosa]
MSTLLDVRVAAIRELTPVIREYSFEALASTLPGFSAGSHVQLHLPNGRRNAYSLLSARRCGTGGGRQGRAAASRHCA